MRPSLARLLAIASLAVGFASAAPAPAAWAASPKEEIDRALNSWHEAASRADGAAYFGAMTDDAVFLGTDPGERWDKKAFQAYAEPFFSKKKGWTIRSLKRWVTVGPGGKVAWFDEDVESKEMGPARGSGVLVRSGRGWKIAQYNLSIPIPNDKFDQARKVISAPAEKPPASK